MEFYLLLGALGLTTGFLSGLLGIGGGIVMAPLLLYVPQFFGFAALPMRTVAGLTIVQALAACLSGGLTHKKFHYVSGRLTLWMGTAIFITALIGGAAADVVANAVMLLVFAFLAFIASVLVFVPTKTDCERPDAGELPFSRPGAVAVAGSVGLLGGLVGQGGSFILIPLMTSCLQIPTRIAIGSNLAIVFLSSLAAFIGKALTGQIAWSMTLPIIATVIPAANLGARVSRRVPVTGLRFILALCIAAAAVRIGFTAIGEW